MSVGIYRDLSDYENAKIRKSIGCYRHSELNYSNRWGNEPAYITRYYEALAPRYYTDPEEIELPPAGLEWVKKVSPAHRVSFKKPFRGFGGSRFLKIKGLDS